MISKKASYASNIGLFYLLQRRHVTGPILTDMPDIIHIARFKTALAHWPHFFSQFSTLVSGINSPGFHQDIEFLKDQLDGFIRMLLIPKNSPHQGSDPGLDLEIIMEMISFLNEQVTCQIIRHAMADLEKSDHFEKKLSNFPSGF